MIMVSHSRDEVYRFSEELLIIDQGQIVAAGRTKELFQNPHRKEAARLTGCKNFTRAVYVDEHTEISQKISTISVIVHMILFRSGEDVERIRFRLH